MDKSNVFKSWDEKCKTDCDLVRVCEQERENVHVEGFGER